MSLSLSSWESISFPIYRVPRGHTLKQEGTILYSYKEFLDHESRKAIPSVRFLDDTSVPADTLGKRRVLLLQDKVKLLKLPKGIYFLSDLIKLSIGDVQFIDSNGLLFSYKKTRNVPLVFKKITKKFPILQGMGTIIEVEGIPSRFKTSCYLRPEQVVAGLLKIDSGYILYGIYDELYDNTTRKV